MSFLFLSKIIITIINPVLIWVAFLHNIIDLRGIWVAFLMLLCNFKNNLKVALACDTIAKPALEVLQTFVIMQPASLSPDKCNRTLCYYDIWVVRVRVLRLHWASENFVKRSINTIYFS